MNTSHAVHVSLPSDLKMQQTMVKDLDWCRGLEQQIALPRDSYLQDYFTDLYAVLRIGPPLYFVVPDINMDPQASDVNMICSVAGCNDTSFANEVGSTMLFLAIAYMH